MTVGDRTGYLVVQHVGEDGMKGTPTLFLRMGDRQRAEIMFSPVYAKEFSGAEAVSRRAEEDRGRAHLPSGNPPVRAFMTPAGCLDGRRAASRSASSIPWELWS